MGWAENSAALRAANLAVHGETIVFEPADGGAPATIPNGGIFRSAHVAIDLNSGATVSSNQPLLDIDPALLPSLPVAHKSFVTVRGKRYVVQDVQPDGEGMLTLQLSTKPRVD